MTVSNILLKSFSENLKKITKITEINGFSISTFLMKTIEFCTVSIADMISACKNTLIRVFL